MSRAILVKEYARLSYALDVLAFFFFWYSFPSEFVFPAGQLSSRPSTLRVDSVCLVSGGTVAPAALLRVTSLG